jgi:hypothetical protein
MHTDDSLYDYALREPRLPKSVDGSLADADIAMDTRLGMYRKLQELRQFEKRAHDLFLQNLVKGTSHLSLGMEAVATGFGAAMRPDDYTFATYRGHAHSLARGMELGPAMAELLGRENGVLGGKGGSMHLTDAAKGLVGEDAGHRAGGRCLLRGRHHQHRGLPRGPQHGQDLGPSGGLRV